MCQIKLLCPMDTAKHPVYFLTEPKVTEMNKSYMFSMRRQISKLTTPIKPPKCTNCHEGLVHYNENRCQNHNCGWGKLNNEQIRCPDCLPPHDKKFCSTCDEVGWLDAICEDCNGGEKIVSGSRPCDECDIGMTLRKKREI
jgi:hypothetical protein